ncbi:amino acid permease [Risungbinella massiliensis]|uniref:amino acid permease n=1 Tax=Risungbinella massiliensis TaxID=1329796 RepID=UPI0005CBEBD9|nr:amino acid permease [Risungbinella massiliensis]
MDLFRRKSVHNLISEANTASGLKRVMTSFDLALLGVGAIIGAGIFVITGTAAVQTGPALVLSFVLAGLACFFAALCYAEFASTVPASGSVYTYSYATLGEFVAWVIGWDLVLEYLLAVSSIAAGWSGYFQNFLKNFGVTLPEVFTAAPGTKAGISTVMDVPAFVIIILITFLLSRGVSTSKIVNNIMVFMKVAVILLFLAVGVFHIEPTNYQPFMPFGVHGVLLGAASVFFAYIGFDAVASAAEETKNPQRDLPRGLLWSLGISTILYVVVSAVMTGVVPFMDYEGVNHPVTLALDRTGEMWASRIVDIGAIFGLMTGLIVMLYGQTRIFFSMSRDGLLPKFFSQVHSKFQTPFRSTWLLGALAAFIAAFVPLGNLAELVNIGTLFAFTLVAVGVLVLRKTQPDLPRGFRTPFVPLVPLIAIGLCLFLMTQLAVITWLAFGIWLVIGLAIYFLYSRKHSRLNE